MAFPAGTEVGASRTTFLGIIDDTILEDTEGVAVDATIVFGDATFSDGMESARAVVLIADDDLSFDGNTPTVDGNVITINFNVNNLVTSAKCSFKRTKDTVDCKPINLGIDY